MLKPKKSKKTSVKATGLNFELGKISPMTVNQQKVFDLYTSGKNLVLYGSAGSGKSFLSLYLGLKEMLDEGTFNKIVIIRNILPVRDVGFLKGSLDEKIQPLSLPYVEIVNDLFNRDDAFSILTQKRIIEFTSTSYLRGLTYNDALIIVDEIQNLTFHELDTVFSRVGENSKIILCGDYKQYDISKKEVSGFYDIMKIVDKMHSEFVTAEFTTDDIVRSGFVKSYLIAKNNLGF